MRDYILFWLPMIILAFVNALLREIIFIKHFSELRAHQLSTITLTVLCSIYIWLVFPWLAIQNSKQAFLLGFIWMILTMGFEFSLGIILKRPWPSLLQQYNIFDGHIWPLFLIFLLILPYLCYIFK